MGEIVKQIPNALCIIRALLGIAVIPLALTGLWMAAFMAVAVAVATDMLDGYLAKKLDAKSDFGRDVLEPNCDLALVVGSLAGLVLSETVSWQPVVLLVAIPGIGAELLLKRRPEGSLGKKIHNGFMPLHYVAIAIAVFALYAYQAMGSDSVWLLLLLIPASVMAWEKRDRWYGAWLHGQAH